MRGGVSSPIQRMVYASDGAFFATVSENLKIWRASDDLLLRSVFIPKGSLALALSPDDSAICAGGRVADDHPFIRCWRTADGVELWTSAVPGSNPGDTVSKLAFSPDGLRIAAGVGNKLKIWHAADGAYLADFSGTCPTCFAGGLSYSPDGQFLAVNTAYDYPRLALLNRANGALLWDFGGSSVSVAYDAAFSPDSQLVASVNGAGLHVFGTFDHFPQSFTPGLTVR
jgi:WD40 repeat protein